jgi:alpha-D-xyloside xylohydrolase
VAGVRWRTLELPAGARWTCARTGTEYRFGERRFDRVPLSLRDGAQWPIVAEV